MDKIPASFQIKHHVAPRSFGILTIIITLILTSVFALGWGIANHKENQTLKANNLKFRMLRQHWSAITKNIDSTYYEDPKKSEEINSKLEEERELIKAAAKKRLEAEKIAGATHLLIKYKTDNNHSPTGKEQLLITSNDESFGMLLKVAHFRLSQKHI